MIWMYGGAFNPPTIAHHQIMIHLKKMYPSDTLIIVPVGDHYNKPSLVSFTHRKNMIHLLDASLQIIDVEQHTPFKGTLNTLKYLEKIHKNKVGFVIGADQLETIHTWISYETLLKNHEMLIMKRPHYDMSKYEHLLKTHHATYRVIDLNLDVSSTSFRTQKNEHVLNKNVLKYIQKHHLYEEANV